MNEKTRSFYFPYFFSVEKKFGFSLSSQYFVAFVPMRFVVLCKSKRVLTQESTFILLRESESCRGDKHGRCFGAVGSVLLHFL